LKTMRGEDPESPFAQLTGRHHSVNNDNDPEHRRITAGKYRNAVFEQPAAPPFKLAGLALRCCSPVRWQVYPARCCGCSDETRCPGDRHRFGTGPRILGLPENLWPLQDLWSPTLLGEVRQWGQCCQAPKDEKGGIPLPSTTTHNRPMGRRGQWSSNRWRMSRLGSAFGPHVLR